MTSNANIDDVKALHMSGPVIMTAPPPGPNLQPVSGQAWLLTRHRVIAGWRRETSRS